MHVYTHTQTGPGLALDQKTIEDDKAFDGSRATWFLGKILVDLWEVGIKSKVHGQVAWNTRVVPFIMETTLAWGGIHVYYVMVEL